MAVFVLDKRKRPLMPCTEKRARLLLERGRARVHRLRPFTIRLRDRSRAESKLQPLRLKFDPGSKVTGIALVREVGDKQHVLHLAELHHRGQQIKDRLNARRAFRRRRRSNLRYRSARFENRTRRVGWLPPSLQHRVDTVISWTDRLCRWTPVSNLSMELVRFDTQALQNPEIEGVEYQQGALFGYEVREYLLEKFGRTCVYCGAGNLPLEIDHVVPRSRGGSNRVSNLVIACRKCNTAKGDQPVEVFLADKPGVLVRLKRQLKAPLKDAAAVNATRWALLGRLKATGLPVETATGGRTKYNRTRFGIPKGHAMDAACVGVVDTVLGRRQPVLGITATGRGSYQRTRLDRFGFPRGYLTRQKQTGGFQTGDLVQAEVPTGKKAGVHIGRVAVRASGSFNIQTADGVIQGVSHRYCKRLQRGDGYRLKPQFLPCLKAGVSLREAL